MKTFSQAEKSKLTKLKGVGNTVVSRLEQLGFSEISQLADQNAEFVTKQISEMIGSTCWHNSPSARNAINSIILLARAPKQS